MITISNQIINNFSSEIYFKILNTLPFRKLSCTCGITGNIIKHGHYFRSIKLSEGKVKIKIQRVLCKSCGRSHAILTKDIVPYSNILLDDQIQVINAINNAESTKSIMENNPEIDESNIYKIIKKYLSYWKERLLSYQIPIDSKISCNCFYAFGKQFMQIKWTSNILFSLTT